MVKETIRGTPYAAEFLWRQAAEGRVFVASDADQNDTVTGQETFANTTPTFLLDVPVGTTAVPLGIDLSQSGTVAGGDIIAAITIDNVGRYASGGTAEKIFTPTKARSPNPSFCKLYSGATATAGYGIRLWGATIAPDVSPAEGIVPGPFWTPTAPFLLQGPAALMVFTYSSGPGPTWLWSITWTEMPTDELVEQSRPRWA